MRDSSADVQHVLLRVRHHHCQGLPSRYANRELRQRPGQLIHGAEGTRPFCAANPPQGGRRCRMSENSGYVLVLGGTGMLRPAVHRLLELMEVVVIARHLDRATPGGEL